MSDINFIADNENKDKIKKDKNSSYRIKWTDPEKDKLIEKPFKMPKQDKEKGGGELPGKKLTEQTLRIKKSRKEVLEMLKKQKEEKISRKNKNKSGLKAGFFSLFKNKEKPKAQKKDFAFKPLEEKPYKRAVKPPPIQPVRQIIEDIPIMPKKKIIKSAPEPELIKLKKKESWLKNIFKKKLAVRKEKKKELPPKQMLADYSDVFKKEKKKRVRPITYSKPKPEIKPVKAREIKQKIIKNKSMTTPSKWEAPKILKTNLAQKEEKVPEFDMGRNIKFLLFNVLSVLLLMAAIYGALVFWESDAIKNSNTRKNLMLLKDEVISLQTKVNKLSLTEERLNLAAGLLNEHIYWTQFFGLLEKYTLGNVYYYDGFSGDLGYEYNLKGRTDTYSSFSNQLYVMRGSDMITEVVPGSAMDLGENQDDASPESKIEFEMGIKIKPEVLKK